MRVAVQVLGSSREPHKRVYRGQMLAMLLHPGSIEIGWRRSELTRFDYGAGRNYASAVMSKRGLASTACSICLSPFLTPR